MTQLNPFTGDLMPGPTGAGVAAVANTNSFKRRAGIFGDSRMANCSSNAISTGGAYTTMQGAYTAIHNESHGFISWVTFLTRQRVTFDQQDNFGVGGNTTADMLARIADPIASQAQVIFCIGGTNDPGSGLTIKQSVDNWRQIISKLQAAGKTVILFAELPRGDTAFSPDKILTGTQLDAHFQLREWIRLRARDEFPRLYVADPWADLAQYNATTGAIITGNSIDGLHPNPVGAYHQALCCVPIINRLFDANEECLPRSSAGVFNATTGLRGWLNSNPTMDGTDGTVASGFSGVNSHAWTLTKGSAWPATPVTAVSKVARSNGNGYWQQFVIGCTTTASTSPELTFYQDVTANCSIGDILQAVAEIEVDAGQTGLKHITVSVVFNGSGSTSARAMDRYDSTNIWPNAAVSGIQRTPPIRVPTNMTTVRVLVSFLAAESTAVAATVRIGNVGVKKVYPYRQPEDDAIALANWKLTLPVDNVGGNTPGGAIEYTPASGYSGTYFNTTALGSIIFSAPAGGATTSGSTYPRSELRELINPADDNVNWLMSGHSNLACTLRVRALPTSGVIIIGQVHGLDANPVVKLVWTLETLTTLTTPASPEGTITAGTITAEVRDNPVGGSSTTYTLASSVPIDEVFSYVLDITGGILTITTVTTAIRTARPTPTTATQTVTLNSAWADTEMYFKAGVYVQDATFGNGSGTVEFYSITPTH